MSDVVIYDPDDPVVANRVTKYLRSVNTPDYSSDPNTLVNPDLSGVSSVAQKYWKESSGAVVEMSAQEKTDIDDYLDSLVIKQFTCRVTRTPNQPITNASLTDITFPTEDQDVSDMHDIGVNTDRVTIPTGGDGFYLITAGVMFDSNSTGTRRVGITINNVLENAADEKREDAAATQLGVQVGRGAELVAGDIVRLRVYQTSGGDLNINAARMEVCKSA